MKSIFLAFAIIVLTYQGAVSQPVLTKEYQKQAFTNFKAMPLAFTENLGQWNRGVLFRAETGGAAFFFCKGEVTYVFNRDTGELLNEMPEGMPEIMNKLREPRYKTENLAIKAQFVGANVNAEVSGETPFRHNSNYFLGNDPSRWHSGVPSYAAIIYKDIWPGIDLRYHGNGSAMKYDFIVRPGGDLSQIQIKYNGAGNLSCSGSGDLEMQASFGLLKEIAPSVYQESEGRKRIIAARYKIEGDKTFGFEIDESYNPSEILVIDPELVYSTYLGGSGGESADDIAVDNSGNMYVVGYTSSSDFPIANPFQPYQDSSDVFITGLSPTGDSLLFSTYFGGYGNESGSGIALDENGNIYITGRTTSPDFPTVNFFQKELSATDAFVSKFSPEGDSLLYSTYLGGTLAEYATDIAVDQNGCAYVTGWTFSWDFPTQNPLQLDQASEDAFITKFCPDGDSLIYSTYFGGNSIDLGAALAVDSYGNAYITGITASTDLILRNPFQSYQGDFDDFVAKLGANGDSLIFSTYLGGNGAEMGPTIAVDCDGSAYVAGVTYSDNFPTRNPYQTRQYDADIFVTKFGLDGDSLIFSTYLGGNDLDWPRGIKPDSVGNVYVTGYTFSLNFPITQTRYQPDQPVTDVFLTKFAATGNALRYSTYLGGNDEDYSSAIALGRDGGVFLAGSTRSSDFPTENPYQGDQPGMDAFISKFDFASPSCVFIPGDVNGIGGFNGLDVSYGVAYFKGGPPPPYSCDCPPQGTFYVAGDVNQSCSFNGLDVTYMVAYFKGGPPPHPCPYCMPSD